MKEFSRVFKYIGPQWPRVVVVFISAMAVSVLLSLSFMTLIPLLKVMTGEEGLRGWLDRKACEFRYGLKFSVPQSVDFAQEGTGDLAHYLLITSLDTNSVAYRAGLQAGDRIMEIVPETVKADGRPSYYIDILDALAHTDKAVLNLSVKRLNDSKGAFEKADITLETTPGKRLNGALSGLAVSAARIVPLEQTSSSKVEAVVIIILAIGAVTVVRCIAKFYQGYLAEKVVQVGLNELREEAFIHLMDMPIGFFNTERPSDSVSRLVRDTGAMGHGIKILLGKGLREPMTALFMLGFAAILDWQLTLVFFCGAPPTLWAVSSLGRKMKRASRKSLVAWSQMLAKLQEVVNGLKVVKVYERQQSEYRTFREINKRLLKQLLKISRIDSATNPILEVLAMGAGAGAIIIGTSWVTSGKIDGSEFLVLLGSLGAAAEATRKTADIWNKIQEANAASERVFAIIDEPLEMEKGHARELSPLKEKIEFRNVFFTYPGSESASLKGINLTVQAGHNVAIVGPNGSGKTTLANLIPRFYDPQEGQILIDGTDISDVSLKGLRRQIGMVTQQIVTFNDTIAANIGYGKPEATREEIIEAARRAYAHEFIEELPGGYETIIGEQGTGLSGGQLQRIVIARAVLKNPAIMIFDEATSQIDADSESKIHKALEEILHNRTCFIIAHRFSTIIAADVIVVMDNGRILAQGHHEELMRKCSLYHSLYETQLVKT